MAIEDTIVQLEERFAQLEGELVALRQEHTLLRENFRKLLRGLAQRDEGKALQVWQALRREDSLTARATTQPDETEVEPT